jgi:hypothetical protein
MTLTIDQAVQLWEIAKYHPLNYFHAPQAYGEARFVIPSCDITVLHAHRVMWGPLRKWGTDYPDRLEYEWVEISHPEFYVEIMSLHHTLLYYCKNPVRKARSHSYFKDRYDLEWVGDVSYLHDALTYHDLIKE